MYNCTEKKDTIIAEDVVKGNSYSLKSQRKCRTVLMEKRNEQTASSRVNRTKNRSDIVIWDKIKVTKSLEEYERL